MNSKLRIILILVVILHLIIAEAVAQDSLKGVVKYRTAEPLPYVTVKSNSSGEAVNRGAVTDLNGEYLIGDIKEGKYTLTIMYAGFRKVVRKNICQRRKDRFPEICA